MTEASPASSTLSKSALTIIEARKCEGCDLMFVPRPKNRRYHDEPCRKKSENQRQRGPSFTERVIAVKGRRCGKCGSERNGKRTAFCWTGEEGQISRAVVLCSFCLEDAHAKRKGQDKLTGDCAQYAEQDPSEREEWAALRMSILPSEECDVVDSAPNIINKSNLDEASRDTHPRELFCRHCERRLCQISPDGDVIALNKREVVCKNGAVACTWCREENGLEIWTKISKALPDTVTHGPIPTPERLLKVDRIPLSGRTVAQMLHDLGIAKIAGEKHPLILPYL